jgi:Cu-Zn family superoxide dismutase
MRVLSSTLVLLLGACAVSMGPPRTRTEQLRVGLFDASGASVGSVVLTSDSVGMTLAFDVHDLPPGPHAVHVHAAGKCERPDFLSAGPHLDQGGHQHGLDNPAGPHLGDLEDLHVGPDGTARATLRLTQPRGRFTTHSLLDSDGSAIIIHAGPDDRHTDPSGNSGPRIACGIVA